MAKATLYGFMPGDGSWGVDKIAAGVQRVANDDAGYTVFADTPEEAKAELDRLVAMDAFVEKVDLTKSHLITITIDDSAEA